MSKRPFIKSDAAGNLTDLELDAASVDGHIMEQIGISSDTTTIPTTAQVKSYVDSSAGGITTSVDSSIYIYLLPAGIYKFTYNGAKTFYYTSGNTISDSNFNFSKDIILTISTSGNYKVWYMLNGSGGQYLISGWATGSGSDGGYRKHDISQTYLTSHRYRPIQVNGTQILANTASTALNLANDGNVKFTQVSGGKIKADFDLDAIYPVGAIYLSVNSTSPASLFGGTWEQIKDKFLLGSGDTYTAGATGGEATHTLTQYELPQHKHAIQLSESGGGTAAGDQITFNGVGNGTFATHTLTRWMNYVKDLIDVNGNENINANQPHNNMPPYLVVYMWKRTA